MNGDKVPPFGQGDPTDGRELRDWRSRYAEPEAQKAISREATYLACLLASIPVLMVVLWLGWPNHWLRLPDPRYRSLLKYALAWLAGMLGGTLFDIKWLYHSVARQIWNMDRRLWRRFTPHISGGLAFAMVALIASGLVKIFDSRSTNSLSSVVGVGFLVGYFSDSAIAKLTEVAETLFGTSRSKEKHAAAKGAKKNFEADGSAHGEER